MAPGRGGRGVGGAPQPGIPAGMGGDSLGGGEQSLPGLGSGAPSPLILGIPPPSTRQTSAEEGVGRGGGASLRGSWRSPGNNGEGMEVGGRRAHTRAEEGERARAGSGRRPSRGAGGPPREGRREGKGRSYPRLAGWSGPAGRERASEREREGPAVQHAADAGERREDAGELGVACTVALLTSGSLAAGALPEGPRAGKGAGCLAVPQGEAVDVQARACHCPTAHAFLEPSATIPGF